MKTAEYPILFRGDTEDFTTNGMGRLSEAESCLVTEALNGGYECVLTYPKNGRHAADIRQKRFLYMKPNEKSNKQAFRIYKIEETSDGEKMVVRGQHRSYDLSGYPVKPFTAEGISPSLQGLSSNIMLFGTGHNDGLGNPYRFETNITNETSKFKLTEPRSVRACLGGVEGSFIQLFKAELEFDGTTVKLWAAGGNAHGRGADNNVTIRYGKNLEKFVNVRTTESAYSGVLAYYKSDKKVIYGDIYRVTNGLDEKDEAHHGNLSFPASRIFMLDASSDFTAKEGETQKDPEPKDLTARAKEYAEDNNIGVPYLDTVTVSFVPLWETEEYKDVAVLEQVSLGDTVHVKYGRFDFKTRMVEYTYDTIKGRYTSCTLGTKQATFSNTIQQVAGTTSAMSGNVYSDSPNFSENVEVTNGVNTAEFGIKPTGIHSGRFYASGFVTRSSTTAVLYIHGGMTGWYSSRITNIIASIRTADGGYLGGAENSDLTSYIEYQAFHENQNMLEVWLTKSGGWNIASNTVITNNTPISGIISIEYSTAKSASYSGKTLSILGDSISTYEGYIPSGQSAFYDGTNCGVSSVDQTWWMRIINSLDMTLNLNNSWGGGRVSKTRSTYTEESSGIYRADKLGTDPDVIITYLGINDFNGEVSKAVFKSSYETMLDNMKTAYPNAEIFCATLPPCERNGSTGDPEINDDGVALTEYNDIIREVILEKGVKLLDFANCGITYSTLSQYMGDWESATGKALHPNSEGHRLIAQKAIRDMFD